MADITLHGTVLANGDIKILDEHHLTAGQAVEIIVRPSSYAAQIEATKRKIAEHAEQELSDIQRERIREIYALMEDAIIEDAGLPDDYADELDHYLYGTPKRRQSSEE